MARVSELAPAAAGRRDERRRGGFAEMGKDRAHGLGVGGEDDGAHRATGKNP